VAFLPWGSGIVSEGAADRASKTPTVTAAFWIIKILATTLGETGGDALSMTLKLGYLASTAVFFGVFLVMLALQVSARRFNPVLYWLVILSTTTAGTTLSDFLDRTAHLGYVGGALALVAALIGVLAAWRLILGRIVFDHVAEPRAELFYWLTILVSNTLGTALGDFLSDSAHLGYLGGAAVVGAALAVVAAAWAFTSVSRAALFWLAFVLTRPLGATLGDILTKTHAKGGLDLGTLPASLVLALGMAGLIAFAARRPAPAAPRG
jgi:uncharacterized membrane-anchored protein